MSHCAARIFLRSTDNYLENPAFYMSNTYGGPVSFVDREGNAIDPETLKKELRYDFQETDFK